MVVKNVKNVTQPVQCFSHAGERVTSYLHCVKDGLILGTVWIVDPFTDV